MKHLHATEELEQAILQRLVEKYPSWTTVGGWFASNKPIVITGAMTRLHRRGHVEKRMTPGNRRPWWEWRITTHGRFALPTPDKD